MDPGFRLRLRETAERGAESYVQLYDEESNVDLDVGSVGQWVVDRSHLESAQRRGEYSEENILFPDQVKDGRCSSLDGVYGLMSDRAFDLLLRKSSREAMGEIESGTRRWC